VKWPVLNLRNDLARLSDLELAERVKSAWLAYEVAEERLSRRRGSSGYTIWYSARGPIRHPIAYRVISVFGAQGPFPILWLGLTIGLPFGPLADMHLSLCEIRDFNDEMANDEMARRQPGRA